MSLTLETIEEVWDRASKIRGYDGTDWRVDEFGSPMLREQYGNKDSRYGWVVKRSRGSSKPAPLAALDLRAIQWQNL